MPSTTNIMKYRTQMDILSYVKKEWYTTDSACGYSGVDDVIQSDMPCYCSPAKNEQMACCGPIGNRLAKCSDKRPHLLVRVVAKDRLRWQRNFTIDEHGHTH